MHSYTARAPSKRLSRTFLSQAFFGCPPRITHLACFSYDGVQCCPHQDEDDSQFASQTVNLLQCLTNLAEHPHGRKQLQASLRQLKMLADSRDAQIRKHADIAVRIITWKP